MPRLAKDIVLDQRVGAGTAALLIDGEPFPWKISPRVTVPFGPDEIPSVTVTIFAERVLVENMLGEGATRAD